MSTQAIAGSDEPNTVLSPIIFLFGFVIVVLLMAFGGQAWQDYQEKQLLSEQARGADAMYQERKHALDTTGRVMADINDSRSPGSYIRGLTLWEKALTETAQNGASAWVMELQKQERAEVMKILSEINVTQENVSVLKNKLHKISPQLTDAELDQLSRLNGYLILLATIRTNTASSVADKVNALGNGSELLSALGIYMPKFKPARTY